MSNSPQNHYPKFDYRSYFHAFKTLAPHRKALYGRVILTRGKYWELAREVKVHPSNLLKLYFPRFGGRAIRVASVFGGTPCFTHDDLKFLDRIFAKLMKDVKTRDAIEQANKGSQRLKEVLSNEPTEDI
jgi:hypothetical protein